MSDRVVFPRRIVNKETHKLNLKTFILFILGKPRYTHILVNLISESIHASTSAHIAKIYTQLVVKK